VPRSYCAQRSGLTLVLSNCMHVYYSDCKCNAEPSLHVLLGIRTVHIDRFKYSQIDNYLS
jgi:hypothetical protein